MCSKPWVFVSILCFLPLSTFASSITSLVVFGDSLSDNGNAALAGAVTGNYASNAFTDGPSTNPATTTGPFGLWIDQFASKLGVTDPQPFLAGGTNFAVAGALTGENPALTFVHGVPTTIPYTGDQVGIFLSNPLLSPLLSPGTLFTFWAGANDIPSGISPVTAANNIESEIQTLAADKGKQFLWLNLPLLGDTPDGMASGESTTLNGASLLFDAQWTADIEVLRSEGIDVVGVNVEQLFAEILADPSGFGFTNVTDPAGCGFTGASTNCASNNPNQSLFWDGEHPTTAGDALVADLAFRDITVPEPSSLALSFGALCAVALAGIKSRRGSAKS
jgi:phospholipase/lecithinase/hemolysin